jgi:hypothetical protein
MGIIPLLTAIFKMVPALKDLFDQFIVAYTKHQIETIDAAYLAAIKKAINDKDQRDIEKALGSPRAGEQSGIGGTEIRKDLPGVPAPTPKP